MTQPHPGRFTRAAVHSDAGEAELRLSPHGNWQLKLRADGQTSVNQLLRDAGMSSRTFWELFDSKEDCLLAAYRTFSARLGAELQSAWDAEESWPEQVRAAIAAVFDFAAAELEIVRLLLVEVQAAGPIARAAQYQSLRSSWRRSSTRAAPNLPLPPTSTRSPPR